MHRFQACTDSLVVQLPGYLCRIASHPMRFVNEVFSSVAFPDSALAAAQPRNQGELFPFRSLFALLPTCQPRSYNQMNDNGQCNCYVPHYCA